MKSDASLLQIQTTNIQKDISWALIQFNSTENAVMALQTKLDKVKLNVSQVLLLTEIEDRDLMNISELIEERATVQTQADNLQVQLYCGAGEWHRVTSLNMSNPGEQCPSAWVEYVSDGIRVCK